MPNLKHLQRKIEEYFDISGLEDLAFSVDVDWDNIPGQTKRDKTRELILHMQRDKGLPRRQEIIFASTGVKKPADPADKYVSALAGSDIQTNPPETNAAIQEMAGKTFERTVDQMPSGAVVKEIDEHVDFARMEEVLMEEGLKKFADPQKELLD